MWCDVFWLFSFVIFFSSSCLGIQQSSTASIPRFCFFGLLFFLLFFPDQHVVKTLVLYFLYKSAPCCFVEFVWSSLCSWRSKHQQTGGVALSSGTHLFAAIWWWWWCLDWPRIRNQRERRSWHGMGMERGWPCHPAFVTAAAVGVPRGVPVLLCSPARTLSSWVFVYFFFCRWTTSIYV